MGDIRVKDEKQLTRFLLLQAVHQLPSVENKNLCPGMIDCVVETLQSLLSANPGDNLRDVVALGAPFKKPGNQADVACASKLYREMRRSYPAMKHSKILKAVAEKMGLSLHTLQGYWHEALGVDVWIEDNCPEAVKAWKENQPDE